MQAAIEMRELDAREIEEVAGGPAGVVVRRVLNIFIAADVTSSTPQSGGGTKEVGDKPVPDKN